MASEAHPSLFELEAHQVGETPAGVEAHLLACDTCRGYVADLEAEAARFAARANPEEFVRRIRQRAGGGPAQRRPALLRWVPGVVLAASFAGLLLVARPSWLVPGPAHDVVAMKGGAPQVAIILWQGGRQSRRLGSVEGHPGDRYRVEVQTAALVELEAVIVDRAGSTTPVTAARRFIAGTHVLDPTFTFESSPGVARLLVGPPAALRRVLAGEKLPEVTVVPIRSSDAR